MAIMALSPLNWCDWKSVVWCFWASFHIIIQLLLVISLHPQRDRHTIETKGSRQVEAAERFLQKNSRVGGKDKRELCRISVYGWFGCLVMFHIVKPHLDTTSPRGFTCLLSSVGLLIYSCSFDRSLVCCVWKVRFTVSAYDQSINWFIGTVQ